jgi:hypothetical protein
MNRSIIRLGKLISVDQKTTEHILNMMIDSIFNELGFEFEIMRTTDFKSFPADRKKRIESEANRVAKSFLPELKRLFSDSFYKVCEDVFIEDVEVKIVSAVRNKPEFQIYVLLISSKLTVLDNVGDKLLIMAGDVSEDLKSRVPLRTPQLVELNKEIIIAEYSTIDSI